MDQMIIIWLLLGFALIVGEVFIPGLVVIFLGIGAVLNSLLVALFPPLQASIGFQFITWALLSGSSLLLLRRFFKKSFMGSFFNQKRADKKNSGKIAVVSELIKQDHPGRIHFQGTSWEAMCFDEILEPGTKVEILKQEGLHFYVTKATNNEIEEE